MFSLYLKQKKTQAKLEKQTKDIMMSKRKNKDFMVDRYNKRINSNVLALATSRNETPLRSVSPFVSRRDVFKNRTKYFKKLPEKIRNYSCTPQEAFVLRPRDKMKEIQPNLKFKLIGDERLKEAIEVQRQVFRTSEYPVKILGEQETSQDYQQESQGLQRGKIIYGYYHYKLPIKTIESLAMDLHSTKRLMSKDDLYRKKEFYDFEDKDKNVESFDYSLHNEDVINMCSGVLGRYGVWRNKRKGKTPNVFR